MLAGHQASKKCGTGRRTDRIIGKGPGKECAFFRQLIYVRRFDIPVSITAQRPFAMIIGHDNHHVWSTLFRSRKDDHIPKTEQQGGAAVENN